MSLPNYPPELYPDPKVGLVDAYVDFIGQNEGDHVREIFALPKGDLRRASMGIGRACMFGRTDMEHAKRITTGIRAEIEQKARNPEKTQAQQLISITHFIEAKGDPEKIQEVRQIMHRKTVGRLSAMIKQLQEIQGVQGKGRERRVEMVQDLSGTRNEQRALAVLNRIHHPWLLALPSLEHHDETYTGRSANNFDVLMIESGPHTPKPLFQRVQVKSDCFGQCSLPQGKEKIEANKQFLWDTRRQYASDITIISGCCDFQQPERLDTQRRGPWRVDGLLANELGSGLSLQSQSDLDAITNHVMMVATNGHTVERSGVADIPGAILRHST